MRWVLRHKILSALAAMFLLVSFLSALGALIGPSPATTDAANSPAPPASSARPPTTAPTPAEPTPAEPTPATTATAIPAPSQPASTEPATAAPAAPSSDPASVIAAQPPAPAPATGNPDAEGARAWIDKTNGDTHSVQVAVQSVQGGIKLVQDGATDAASQAALSSLVKQSHDFLHDASLGLVTEIDDPLKSQREEAFQAASQLSDAMSKLRSYIDSSKPSDLADFQTNYQQGVQFWNEAVTKIWAAAGRPGPPTV